jgi:hypothetical protein
LQIRQYLHCDARSSLALFLSANSPFLAVLLNFSQFAPRQGGKAKKATPLAALYRRLKFWTATDEAPRRKLVSRSHTPEFAAARKMHFTRLL